MASNLTKEQLLAYFTHRFVVPKLPWTIRAWRKFLLYAVFWRPDKESYIAYSGGSISDQVADYIEAYGVTDGNYIVITKTMVDNIRRGKTSDGK